MSPLISFNSLSVGAQLPSGEIIQTIHDVSFDVSPGEVVALIGGSGAGKTTIALAAMGYTRPGTWFSGGEILFKGKDLLEQDHEELCKVRGKDVAYVAQSAQAALNPAYTIETQIGEMFDLHGPPEGVNVFERTEQLLDLMSLPDPMILAQRYPHELSGGQQQRVMTAMAMSCTPSLLVLDEPTTALDVTTQIGVLKAIKDLIRESGTAGLYVSHDLAVVSQIADRIIVLKDGRIMEDSETRTLITTPAHEYTKTLFEFSTHFSIADSPVEVEEAELEGVNFG